ncbi:hypothetical protein BSKO_12466 [Bryopsis sp. KO-2023]|nr:hypothetical protein BSKO_12466 [Bryopsis sp. KO-2023]
MPGAPIALQHFLRTADKVSQLCFHPVQPWLAYVDKNSAVHVLNWESQEVLYAAQFGGIDEAAAHYQGLQRMMEQDPAFWGDKTSHEHQVSKTVSGRVRMVQFLDVETIYWQRFAHLSLLKAKPNELLTDTVPGGEALRGQRWLIVVCDNKVVLHDMISHASKEISKLALEGKNPAVVTTLVAPGSLSGDPILAVGCSDGGIRLLSLTSLTVIGKLGQGQKASHVNSLMTLHLTSKLTRLISGGLDGTMCVWDPFPNGRTLPNSLTPPSVTLKAHEGEVTGIELTHGPEEGSLPRILTIGGDRTCAAWEVGAYKEVLRFKQPSQRVPCHSVCYCPALTAAPENSPILMATNANKIWGSTIATGAFKTIADTGNLLGSMGKSAPKIYKMVVHPLQSHLIAVGLSSGVAVLRANPHALASVKMLPSSSSDKPTTDEMLVISWFENRLCQREYIAVQQDGSGNSKPAHAPEMVFHNEVTSASVLNQYGYCDVSVHSSGLKIVLVWPNSFKYIVFRKVGPSDWEKCHEGAGVAAVWNSYSSQLAVLDAPAPIQIPQMEKKARGRGKMDAAAMEAIAAAQQAAASEVSVKIVRVPGKGMTQEEGDLNTTDTPCGLFPGPILGVVFDNPASDQPTPGPSTSATPTEDYTHSFHFFDWKTRSMCSSEMHAPLWIEWCPAQDVCAMAYPSHILICESVGNFEPLTSVPIVDGVSGVWDSRQLYVSTPHSVECVVAPRMAGEKTGEKPELTVQVVTLVSFKAGPKWLNGEMTSPHNLPQPRPVGQLSVLGVRGDNLWLVDSLGNPTLINLSTPGFAALRHMSEKHYGAARSAAMGKVSADALASVLVGMGTKSAIEALKLPTLSLEVRLRVAIEAGYFKHALVCLEALAMGCDRPEAVIRLPKFMDTLKDQNAKEDIPAATYVNFSAMDVGLGSSPFATQPPPGPPKVQTADGAYEDGIDFETPLKEITKPRAAQESRYGKRLSETVAGLGIKLIDSSVNARLNNTAMQAAKLIMHHLPPDMGSELLLQLQTRLAERGKQEELKENMELSEEAKITTSGRFAGLAAAALTGNSLLMSSVLKDLKMMTA